MSAYAGDSVYALLADGTTIEIRQVQPDDFAAVRELHERMSPDNLYLRFFSMSPVAAEQAARRICREAARDHAALLAVLDGEVAGYCTFERFGAGSPRAEVAMAVADDMHNRGAGTLRLEHLVSLARGQGVRTFVAETLSENALMLLRVSQIAGDLPEIAELDLNPVIAWPDGVQIIDAPVRIQAAEPADAYLRRLP